MLWGQADAEPVTLVRALAEQRHRFARTRVFLGVGLSGAMEPGHADAIDFLGYCGSGSNRRLAEAGLLDIWPGHYSDLPARIRSGALRIDVLMLQVPPADAQGRHSLGLAHEYLLAALDTARVVIAEVNDQAPWTMGLHHLDADAHRCQRGSVVRAAVFTQPGIGPGGDGHRRPCRQPDRGPCDAAMRPGRRSPKPCWLRCTSGATWACIRVPSATASWR